MFGDSYKGNIAQFKDIHKFLLYPQLATFSLILLFYKV